MEQILNNIWHAYVGNETSPWVVALARALVGAALLGASGFLTTWSQTDEVKLLAIAGLTPAIGYLILRAGLEGVIDTGKRSEQ
jgi:hypothetical protein